MFQRYLLVSVPSQCQSDKYVCTWIPVAWKQSQESHLPWLKGNTNKVSSIQWTNKLAKNPLSLYLVFLGQHFIYKWFFDAVHISALSFSSVPKSPLASYVQQQNKIQHTRVPTSAQKLLKDQECREWSHVCSHMLNLVGKMYGQIDCAVLET